MLATFRRLDRGHNLVALSDWRLAMGWSRADFDRTLCALRIAGTIGLSAQDRRNADTDRLTFGGIEEDGTMLVYASLRRDAR